MKPPEKETGAFLGAPKTTKLIGAYSSRQLGQPQIRKQIRQRRAKLKRCSGLSDPERHAVRFLLRRKRFRILEKDLINRLYAEHVKETA
jgi:hypothetical protein